jgi:HlyD family secretion protein
MMATITLNEVDVAKVRVGQRATMTFDAIDELTITGKVTSVDTVGTVSQGVVTYTVEIGLDTDDQRIKPGMSVSASIITDVKQDTLLVPNSAVKSSNGSYYVEMFSTPLISTSSTTPSLQGTPSKIAPNKITIEVGISNDSDTEIISGVKEGDQVVTKTINPSTTTTSSQTPSLFGNMRTGGNSGTRSTTSR